MNLNERIPRLIHYCWFGPAKRNIIINSCISAFCKLMRGKIICWNETNISEITNEYAKRCYVSKDWAFVSDYLRLWALYYHGGIYLDTDIEVKKKLPDSFFDADLIVGYAYDDIVCTAFIMVKPHHPFIKYLLDMYDNFSPDKKIVNNSLFTQALMDYYPNFVLDGKYREFAPNNYIYPRTILILPLIEKMGDILYIMVWDLGIIQNARCYD